MNEFELINKLTSKLTYSNHTVIRSIGDDAACVLVNKAQMLVSCDEQIDGVHFLTNFGGFGVGFKLVVSNASDILACGGVPKWLTISLTLNKNYDLQFLEDLYSGIDSACKRYGIAIIGGNTTMANELKIGATIIGATDRFVSRDGAAIGDRLYLSATVGKSKAGLEQLLLGNRSNRFTKNHLEASLPISLQPIIAKSATSAVDISDGFYADLMHIVEQSGVGFRLYDRALLFDDELASYLGSKDLAFEYALSSGEEYQLLFTLPKDHKTPDNAILIGEAIDEQAIKMDGKILSAKGFLHF